MGKCPRCHLTTCVVLGRIEPRIAICGRTGINNRVEDRAAVPCMWHVGLDSHTDHGIKQGLRTPYICTKQMIGKAQSLDNLDRTRRQRPMKEHFQVTMAQDAMTIVP